MATSQVLKLQQSISDLEDKISALEGDIGLIMERFRNEDAKNTASKNTKNISGKSAGFSGSTNVNGKNLEQNKTDEKTKVHH